MYIIIKVHVHVQSKCIHLQCTCINVSSHNRDFVHQFNELKIHNTYRLYFPAPHEHQSVKH